MTVVMIPEIIQQTDTNSGFPLLLYFHPLRPSPRLRLLPLHAPDTRPWGPRGVVKQPRRDCGAGKEDKDNEGDSFERRHQKRKLVSFLPDQNTAAFPLGYWDLEQHHVFFHSLTVRSHSRFLSLSDLWSTLSFSFTHSKQEHRHFPSHTHH